MFTQTCERGEWWEIGARLTKRDHTGRDTGEPLDLTGCEVSVVVRTGPKPSDPVAPGDSVAWAVDATSGLVAAGGRNTAAGKAYGTITVTKKSGGAELPGWPQHEMFELRVADHA